MMYRKIMVPLDGSTLSEKVLPYVIRLATRLEAHVLLLRVVETQTLLVTTTPQHRQEAIEKGQAYLHQIRRVITDPELLPSLKPDQVQTLCAYGSPVEEISRVAATEKVDLSIMTTHGRSGLTRFVAGSVASRVLHEAVLPVMLIRPVEQKNDQLLTETLYGLGEPTITCFDASGGHLLVTLDGSLEAAAAIEPAIELAQKMEATLHLLNVIIPTIPVVYGEIYGVSYDQDQLDEVDAQNAFQARNYLDIIQKQVQATGLKCVKVIKEGHPAREIVHYSRQIGAKAIVMTSHKRSELDQVFIGSFAQEVLYESHLPVLMVPTAHYLKEIARSEAKQLMPVVSQ